MRYKEKLQDLAVFQGPPACSEKLHVGRPNVGDRARLMERLNSILDRRWLTNAGPVVHEFEQEIAARVGVKHCIAICSGEIALEIAIRALELNGEVIIPSFTFVATAHALQWQHITPVFADINPADYVIDPESVERLVTPRTTGIIGVHLFGHPCPVRELEVIASRHGLQLLFDAAHAFGCSHKEQPIGRFGRAEVFSFHATKMVNSLEGGAIVTNDDELARKIRLIKNFGFLGFDNVGYLGTNGKMDEFSAAMGLTSLESMDAFIQVNRRNYDQYSRELRDIRGVRLLDDRRGERSTCQYVVAEVDAAATGLHRARLLDVLWAENVLARRYFYPGCHRMEPYRSHFPDAGLVLPQTERVCERVMLLPTGQQMTEERVRGVCQLIRLAMEHGEELACHLENGGARFKVHPDFTRRPPRPANGLPAASADLLPHSSPVSSTASDSGPASVS